MVGNLGTLGGRREGLDSSRKLLARGGQRGLIGLHSATEGDISLIAPVVVKNDTEDDGKENHTHDRAPHNEGAPVLAGPFEAMLGGIDELIVLKSLTGLLVHLVGSSFLASCR